MTKQEPPEHSLTMLNVGQGDAFVFRLASGEVIVIDCNRPDEDTTPPTISVLDELAAQGNSNIDVLCLTHPHYDHFSGMCDVFRWCKTNGGTIKKLVCYAGADSKTTKAIIQDLARTPRRQESECFREFMMLRKEVERFERTNPPHNFVLAVGRQRLIQGTDVNGNEYFVDVVGPLGPTVERNLNQGLRLAIRQMLVEGLASDEGPANDMSCLLLVKSNGCSVFLTGDSSAKVISEAWDGCNAEEEYTENVGVMKMPHHGSRGKAREWNRNKAIWQRILGPETIALLSYGSPNRYNHPHEDLVKTLHSIGVLTVSSNPCLNCPPRPGVVAVRSDEEKRIPSPKFSRDAVELSIDCSGRVVPRQYDTSRLCDLCNSLVMHR